MVPNFISEGYFTQTVIPRELELEGRVTKRANGQVWKYCEPTGNHPGVTELLVAASAGNRTRRSGKGDDPVHRRSWDRVE